MKYLKAYKKQRSYSCIIDYIRNSDVVLEYENALDKNAKFGETEDDFLFNEDEEKEF